MTTPYKPGRDYRFEYLGEVIDHIERNSCALGCHHATPDEEYISLTCPVMSKIWAEEPMPEFDDRGDEGVVCVARIPLERDINENQDKLF